jgi:hypothetical protein
VLSCIIAVKNLGHILAQSENYARYAHYDKFMTEKEADRFKWVRGWRRCS